MGHELMKYTTYRMIHKMRMRKGSEREKECVGYV